MYRLDNPIKGYAWGSRTAIARLQGRPDSETPEAELWLGAHPSSPSRLQGQPLHLGEWIARDPRGTLGEATAARFHGTLPFLLKVLAAEAPLSLQAHPSYEQARLGYTKEAGIGIPLDAKERNYRDPNPKPELICALEPFVALCGFRAQPEAVRYLRSLGLIDIAERLAHAEYPLALREQVREWLGASGAAREAVVTRVREAIMASSRDDTELAEDPEFVLDRRWARTLVELYPDDTGVAVALLLQVIELRPYQALALDAGNLHAYLHGTGIEIMANSDNVLRGGLTSKHVDVDELLKVLRFDADPPRPLEPRTIHDGSHERVELYDTPFREFALRRHLLRGEGASHPVQAASIVLVIEGTLRVHAGDQELELRPGQSVFVAASDRLLKISGDGLAFVAGMPDSSGSEDNPSRP